MEINNLDKRLYTIYLGRVLLNLWKKYDIITTDNYKGKHSLETCNAAILESFYIYEDLVNEFINYNYFELLNKEDKNYKCSLNTKDIIFECIGTLTHHDVKYPVFIDDYGMEDFIEIGNTTIGLNYDWWYAVDSKEVDSFIDTDDEKKCNKMIEILSNRLQSYMEDTIKLAEQN